MSIRSVRLSVLALVALPALTAGCSKLTEYEGTTNRYGAVDIRGKGTSATTATAVANAIFFESVSATVPNSAEQQADQCVYAAVDSTTPSIGGQKRAGDALALAIGSTTLSLPWEDINARYHQPSSQTLTYKSGDVVSVTIPGSGDVFPSSSISVKLAEPLIPGAVPLPAANAPMPITWNATNDATSAIIISLKYARPSTSTFANEQVICSVKDDGAYEIPAVGLVNFLASPNALRSLTLTRFRTNETLLDSRTLLHIATTVDTTLVFK